MRLGAALLLLLVAAASPAAAQRAGAQPGVRGSQIRNASDDQLIRLFFGPARTFPYLGYRSRETPAAAVPQVSLWFYSAMRGSARPGVCTADRLVVLLRARLDSLAGDPMYRPEQFDFRRVFFIVDRAAAERGQDSRREADRRDDPCEGRDPRRDGSEADDVDQFMKAGSLRAALGAAARAGRALAPLDCREMERSGPPVSDEAACLRALAELRGDETSSAAACPTHRDAPGGCILVITSRWLIEFELGPDRVPRRIAVRGIEGNSPDF